MAISARRFKYLDLETNVPVMDFFGINHNDILNGTGDFLTSVLGGILPDITRIINDLGDFFRDFGSFDAARLRSSVGSAQLLDIASSLNLLFPHANVSVNDLDRIKAECLGYIYDELRRCSAFTERFGSGSGYGGTPFIDNCNVDSIGSLFIRLGGNSFTYNSPPRGSNNPYINYNPLGCSRLAFYSGLLRTAQDLGISGIDAVTSQLSTADQIYIQVMMKDLNFASGFIASEGGGGYDIQTRNPAIPNPCKASPINPPINPYPSKCNNHNATYNYVHYELPDPSNYNSVGQEREMRFYEGALSGYPNKTFIRINSTTPDTHIVRIRYLLKKFNSTTALSSLIAFYSTNPPIYTFVSDVVSKEDGGYTAEFINCLLEDFEHQVKIRG